MKKLVLKREKSSDEGTFGSIEVSGVTFATAELPWENNEAEVSCIPAGTYTVKPHKSPNFGECYWLQDVPDRSQILIHVGNWAGDESDGFKSDVRGCILIGERVVHRGKQCMVTNSRKAFAQFVALVGRETFELEVLNV
jgi:hypothetical protein